VTRLRILLSTIAGTLFLAASTSVHAQQTSQPLLRCGGYCVYTALKVFDKGPPSYDEFEKSIGMPSERGDSMAALQEAAEKAGLHTQAVSTTLSNLIARQEPFCCIAHINGNHFVLVIDADESSVKVVDPPRSFTLPVSTFQAQWNGTALLLSDVHLESEESLSRRLWWILAARRFAWLMSGLAAFFILRKCWLWQRQRG
jgi:ABC-type bacteriocin/lantibiotic exporter with double-glycine peptidase domain